MPSPINRIITIPKEGNSTVLGILARVGSRHEPNNIKGISHFIEHLCFKGTEKRTCKQIASEIENLGGDLNAFTDRELTCYWVKIANKHANKALDVLMDFVTRPIFPPKEIDKEREVILQEMKMYEDNPQDRVWDLFDEQFFPYNSGLHTSTIGTKESLHNLNRNTIIDFYKSHYKDLTLIVVGKVDKKTKFQYHNSSLSTTVESLPIKNKIFFETNAQVKQSNLIIGNHFYPNTYSIDNNFKLELISSIYNDMSGRLFSQVREKNSLCYRIHFYPSIMGDNLTGWKVFIGLEKNQINRAVKLIIKELSRPFSKKEIDIALQKNLGGKDLYFDNNKHIFETIVYCETKNINWERILNYKENLKKVTKDLNNFRKEINFNKFLTVGVVPK
jgi:predicted Zn-dependent peptidase